jgi:PAS domain S-box-containing protein
MTEEAFKLLCFEHSTDFISLCTPQGQFVYVSPNCQKITGYNHHELIGSNSLTYFHQQENEDIEATLCKPLAQGDEELNLELSFKVADGSYRWFKTRIIAVKNNQAQTTYLLAIANDITALKAYYKEFLQSEILLHEAGKIARIGAWELDLETMTAYWSPTTYEIHEVEQGLMPKLEEAINFYAPEARPVIANAINDAVEKGIPYDLKLPFITAKSNRIWVRAVGKPEVKKGKTVRLYGIFQDVNQEFEYQIQQKSLINQLTTQKLQLQEYNQIVSHNLRSPIASLNSLLHYMQEAKTEGEKNDILDNIRNVTTSLNTLLEELVDAVKIINDNNLKYEEIEVDKVIASTTALLQGSLQEMGAIITTDFDKWTIINFPKLYFDSIVLNLMSNAIKYHAESRPLQITITTGYKDDRKTLSFADNGLGIDLNRHKDKIFKLHKTFHRQRPGKGLGLFMTKNQMQATGGDIFVESQVDEGTTFTLVFSNYFIENPS